MTYLLEGFTGWGLLQKDGDEQGEHHVTTEAETGVTKLRAKERQDQQPPAELGGGKEGRYPESQRKHDHADTLMSDLWTLELWDNKVLLSEITQFVYVVMATLGN